MDLRQRQPIWLQLVRCLAHNNAQMTMWEIQTIMLEIHQAKTLNSGNPEIEFILHQGIVPRLRSPHLHTLPSSTTMPHSTWHQAHNQALVQPKNIRVVGHRGKHMISRKEVIVDLKCSPLRNSQDTGRNLQVHPECLQLRLETIQSFGRHHPPPLHRDDLPAHLGDSALASKRNDFSQLQNHGEMMLQGLPICLHYERFPMTNRMHSMRATICRTWAGPNAKPQSAWSKQNPPWNNLPKKWGSPTLVPSTNGRNYGCLGVLRSIGPRSVDRTIWNSCEMDLCTGRQRLQIFWRLSRPGCLWKISIMWKRFGNSGLRCFWRNVLARFGRRGGRQGEAISNRRQIWESTWATLREVTSQSCQIQHSWLRFIKCRTASMRRHLACHSKLCTQMWGTGRRWLISSNRIVAQMNHTVWPWYSNATRRRNNWTKSLWDYTHQGKWWMTLHMVRFHTTVPFLMHSIWNCYTLWNNRWWKWRQLQGRILRST